MSSPTPKREVEPDFEAEPKGPNIFVLYGFLILGLLAAMGFGALIVWPFYLRR